MGKYFHSMLIMYIQLVEKWSLKVPLIWLLRVYILFEKAIFSQMKYFHGNSVHDFTMIYSLLNVIVCSNLAAHSSNPVAPF